jgi:hypothetical protein
MSYLDSGNMISDNIQGTMTNENLGAFDLQLMNQALNITTTPTSNSKIWIKDNMYTTSNSKAYLQRVP